MRELSKGFLTALVVATIAMFVWLGQRGGPLRNPDAPQGGISLQLAYSRANAQRVIDSWLSPQDETGLALSLQWLDYLFVLLYASSLNLLGRQVARGKSGWIARGGRVAAAAGVSAGLLDAVENAAMIVMLKAQPTEFAARTATICSLGKFALLLVAIASLLAASAGGAIRGVNSKTEGAPSVRH